MAFDTGTLSQNLVPSEPHLRDLLELHKKDILLSFNAHHVGAIQTFNPLQQTASATINYKKTFFSTDPVTGVYGSSLVDYPVLLEAPVICLGGGDGALTFPIEEGDECLCLFNDRDIDNWFSGGAGGGNATARLHSFADGIILVGIRSLQNVLLNYDMERVCLRNGETGTTIVGVGETLIKIANATTTLNTLLQSVLTNMQSILTALQTVPLIAVTGSPGGPSPLNPIITADLVSVASSLNTLSTQIEGLLE